MHWKAVYGTFSRRKPLVDCAESKLAKVLSTFDLTALGIGSTLGVGVYVLAGGVSKTTAGPAVVLSFLIAAIASVFAGLCYAEFGARVPKAGSAYVYSYVTIGEFIAFVIGWNLILEYAIGSASVAKAISTYIDSLMGNTIANYSINYMPMDVEGLGKYPDFLSFAITALFTLAVAFGAKESTIVNNVFTLVNLTVVVFVVIAGLFKVDANNWKIPSSQVPEGYGSGGFTPYGISGIIKGAATCFYGFIGFDCIATAGEEAKNPKKSIPISICVSLAIIFLAYFSVSTVLTMMVPYYEQNENAPLPHVFREYGWTAAVYIVSGGALCALLSSLMGAIFPLPRIVFAMASDGLIFRFLGEISPRFKTPFVGTLITGSITGVLSAVFDLSQLINMMSIGTLLAYTMVASCVLILRYCRDDRNKKFTEIRFKKGFEIRRLLNVESLKSPTEETETIAMCSVTLYCFFCFGLGSVICFMADELEQAKPHSILLLIVFAILSILSLIIVYRQPKSSAKLAFKVPFVPWLPGISILINVYLMLKLDYHTWIRFGSWIILGILIYFAYGIRNSNERTKDKSAENGGSRALAINQTSNDTMSTHF